LLGKWLIGLIGQLSTVQLDNWTTGQLDNWTTG